MTPLVMIVLTTLYWIARMSTGPVDNIDLDAVEAFDRILGVEFMAERAA